MCRTHTIRNLVVCSAILLLGSHHTIALAGLNLRLPWGQQRASHAAIDSQHDTRVQRTVRTRSRLRPSTRAVGVRTPGRTTTTGPVAIPFARLIPVPRSARSSSTTVSNGRIQQVAQIVTGGPGGQGTASANSASSPEVLNELNRLFLENGQQMPNMQIHGAPNTNFAPQSQPMRVQPTPQVPQRPKNESTTKSPGFLKRLFGGGKSDTQEQDNETESHQHGSMPPQYQTQPRQNTAFGSGASGFGQPAEPSPAPPAADYDVFRPAGNSSGFNKSAATSKSFEIDEPAAAPPAQMPVIQPRQVPAPRPRLGDIPNPFTDDPDAPEDPSPSQPRLMTPPTDSGFRLPIVASPIDESFDSQDEASDLDDLDADDGPIPTAQPVEPPGTLHEVPNPFSNPVVPVPPAPESFSTPVEEPRALPAVRPNPPQPVNPPQPAKPVAEPNPEPTEGDPSTMMRQIAERRGSSGLKGFCPVQLRERRALADTVSAFNSTYGLKTWYFSSSAAKLMFDRNPTRYAPVAAGADIVLMTNSGEDVEGDLEFAVWYQDRLYLFVSRESRDVFKQNPSMYADRF